MFRNRHINVQIYNYICVPSLLCAELCAEMVWAELVMCRIGYVPFAMCQVDPTVCVVVVYQSILSLLINSWHNNSFCTKILGT